jgi:hypothetical protein
VSITAIGDFFGRINVNSSVREIGSVSIVGDDAIVVVVDNKDRVIAFDLIVFVHVFSILLMTRVWNSSNTAVIC